MEKAKSCEDGVYETVSLTNEQQLVVLAEIEDELAWTPLTPQLVQPTRRGQE